MARIGTNAIEVRVDLLHGVDKTIELWVSTEALFPIIIESGTWRVKRGALTRIDSTRRGAECWPSLCFASASDRRRIHFQPSCIMLRSVSRATGSLFLAVAVVTCGESATSVRRSAVQLSFAPRFSPQALAIYQSLAAFAVTLDNVHIVVRAEGTGDEVAPILKDTTVVFPATADQITIDIDLEIQGSQQTVAATIDLRAGTTTYFEGTQDFLAKLGETTTAPEPILLSYVGPGATAKSLGIFPTISSQPVTFAPSTSFQFQVQALDQSGFPVAGLPVTWKTGDATIATVNANGLVTATTKTGQTTLIATGLNGVTTQTTIDVEAPTQLVILRGDNQTGIAGAALPVTMLVQAYAANGHFVAGATINFSALNGLGSVSPATVTTDLDGAASTKLTLGLAIGAYTFVATVAGNSAATTRVTATATAAAAAALGILAGNNQTDTVRATLGQALTVKVTDAFGNPVAQQLVNFQVTSGRASLLAAVGTAPQTVVQVATGTDGVASAFLVADTLAGPIRVTASLPQTTIAPVTFAATVSPGLAQKLVMVQQPSAKAQATITLGTQPKVQVTDQFGNAVPAGGLTITVNSQLDCTRTACGRVVPFNGGALSLNRSAPRQISPRRPVTTRQIAAAAPVDARPSVPTIQRTQSVSDTFPRGLGGKTQVTTDASGLATFTDLVLNLSAGPWQLAFFDATNQALAPAVSSDIDLSPGPIQSVIAWGLADSTVIRVAGDTLSPSVRVIDKVGNGIAGVPVGWTSLDGLSQLDSTATTTDANGIATPGRWLTIVGVPGPFTIQATVRVATPVENSPLTLWAFVGALP